MSASSRLAFDTNILFYAIDSAAGEKHRVAKRLLTFANRDNTLIVLQTLGELFHSTHRKQPHRLSIARDFIEDCLELFDVFSSEKTDWSQALAIQEQHNIQFWDALILVTAQRAGCPILLSEDFQDGQVFGSIKIMNPFRLSPSDLSALLA